MEKILGYLVMVNVCLAAASMGLHKLVEVFPSLATADSIAGKVVGMLQKLVDILSANVAHKPAAVEAPKAPEAPQA